MSNEDQMLRAGFKKWFAWYPVKVSPTYFMEDDYWVFGRLVWRLRTGTADSYGAEERDVTWGYMYRPLEYK